MGYGAAFPEPARVREYNPSVDDDAMSVVRARIEAAHKANHTYRATYETARQDMAKFILAVVADT